MRFSKLPPTRRTRRSRSCPALKRLTFCRSASGPQHLPLELCDMLAAQAKRLLEKPLEGQAGSAAIGRSTSRTAWQVYCAWIQRVIYHHGAPHRLDGSSARHTARLGNRSQVPSFAHILLCETLSGSLLRMVARRLCLIQPNFNCPWAAVRDASISRLLWC